MKASSYLVYLACLTLLTQISLPAMAHNTESLGGVLFELNEHGFFDQPMGTPSDLPFYVELPDGTRTQVASEMADAARELYAYIPNAASESDDSMLARIKQWTLQKLSWRYWASGVTSGWWRFSLRTGASAMMLLKRYGKAAAVPICIWEFMLHSLQFPETPLCLVVNSFCIKWSQPLKEVWNVARNRYPADQAAIPRIHRTVRTMWARYKISRLMDQVFSDVDGAKPAVTRKDYREVLATGSSAEEMILPGVFWPLLLQNIVPADERSLLPQDACEPGHFGCSHKPLKYLAEGVDSVAKGFPIAPFLRPLDPNRPELVRILASLQQDNFLNMIVTLAEAGAASIEPNHPFYAARLRVLVGDAGGALLRYGQILAQMATNDAKNWQAQANREALISEFIIGFFKFHSDLARYLTSINNGYVPVRTDFSQRLFAWPKAARALLKKYQKRGTCEVDLADPWAIPAQVF